MPGDRRSRLGNPQEMPTARLVKRDLERNAVPQDKAWFADKFSEEEPRAAVARSLGRERECRAPAGGRRDDGLGAFASDWE